MELKKKLVRNENGMLVEKVELKKEASDKYKIASFEERKKMIDRINWEVNQEFFGKVKVSEVL